MSKIGKRYFKLSGTTLEQKNSEKIYECLKRLAVVDKR
jgi:hypothetical protein